MPVPSIIKNCHELQINLQMKLKPLFSTGLCALSVALGAGADEADWPQLAHDAARTAHAASGIAPPYRPRWIWCGPDKVLRNQGSNPAWPDNLEAGPNRGANYPMPEQVSFTFSGRSQPVVAGGRVFIGDLDGRVYCLDLNDGRTLWTSENPGGTCASLVVAGDVAVATAIPGGLTGYDAATGQQRWHVETPKAITAAPLLVGTRVFSGCHDGRIYAVEAQNGKVAWTS